MILNSICLLLRQPVQMTKQLTVCHSGIPVVENQCLGTSVVKR